MNIKILKPKKALNKSFLKSKPHRSEIENFKTHLITLLNSINKSETEEFHKNLAIDFLKKSYYDDQYFINTKGRNDLVIHNGKTAKTNVGVIIEVKSPTNKYEMIKSPAEGDNPKQMPLKNLNRKAFQELVLYYLRERITHKNIEIKHLIATNIHEWFIFDVQTFDRLFAQNKNFVKQFQDFEAGRLAETKTDFFYSEIASSFIDQIQTEIQLTYFDFRSFEKPLKSESKKDDNKLIALFKLLSPEHLLKLSFANDSNSLDRTFYSELLHIIGLTEITQSGKKLIERPKPKDRNSGTLLESTIIQLDSLDVINRMPKASQYGKSTEERHFNVALELVITWVNRILFLKLMEAQLIKYNNDVSYSFLNYKKIKNYDDLNSLFFQVLAKQKSERNAEIAEEFKNVPYLNSSLFEPADIERNATIYISGLRDEMEIPIHNKTVLKDESGRRKTGKLTTLQYLFEFLNAYDFSSEGSEEIQEENKTLINASVLGLIFEKINGYKDGSFFTPGFVTMFMARESIRKATIQKFNEIKGWNCNSTQELYNKIEDINEANKIVNSIKICDPAVGSGHFLVSSLNEMIALKNDLKILQDTNGLRLKEYQVEVANDELIVTDEDGELFEYHPSNKESQRIQKALFHEKQTIIENCLFGVDINPNSVKICRLRLWIELLKNAYYKTATELETLPNIDINIKQGNSLISRFSLSADLKSTLKKNNLTIEKYRTSVSAYHNAKTKEQKRELEELILKIKQNFSTQIRLNDPLKNKLDKLASELYHRFTGTFLFESEIPYGKKEKKLEKQRALEQKELEREIAKLQSKIDEIKNNKIFENSFEWRFEFPEVLNDDGDFLGFDVVIANPPYMRVQEIQRTQPKEKLHYESKYKNAKAAYDLANLFFELAINISAESSNNAFIFPHKFFNSSSSTDFRDYLKSGKYIDKIAHFGANMIFDDADTYTCIAQFNKTPNDGFLFQRFPFKSDFQSLMAQEKDYAFITYQMLEKASELYGSNQWILFDNEVGFQLFEKIYERSKLFKNTFSEIFVGLQTSRDSLYVVECLDETNFTVRVPISGKEYQLERDLFKPFLMGKDVHRYSHLTTSKYVFFPYKVIDENTAEIIQLSEIENKYPKTYQYLTEHSEVFKDRESGKAGKMEYWYAYIYPKNLTKFEQPKLSSMEICANHPNVTFNPQNLYHTTKVYSWVKSEQTTESYEYLLAIANSKLLWWFLKLTGDTLQGDARTFKTNYLNPFPIPEKVNDETETAIKDKVNQVLEIKAQDPKSDTSLLENEIDRMVYELYGLNEEEIEVIENI